MSFDGERFEPFWERPQKRHAVAVASAVVFSILLHIILFRIAPPLPIGKPATWKAEVRLPPVQMLDVQREMRLRPDQPEIYRPENPDEYMALAPEREAMKELLDEFFPEPFSEADFADVTEEAPQQADLAPSVERKQWEPRQDILQIEEAIHADDVSVLPRRYQPEVERVAEAPDIALPTDGETEAFFDAVKDEGVVRLAQGDTSVGGAPLVTDIRQFSHDRSVEIEMEKDVSVPEELVESASILDELPEEITTTKPVEQLLTLDIETYTPSDESSWMYFRIRIRENGADALPVLPRDLVFLQDCSESMTRSKVAICKDGLVEWVDTLRLPDHFNMIRFDEAPYTLFAKWMPVSERAIQNARLFVDDMEARGKTDVSASLEEILTFKQEQGRPGLVVFVTDGRPTAGMVDSSDIIEDFTRRNGGRISMFTIAAGSRVNRFLLDMLSYKNRGDSIIVEDKDEIPGAMREMRRQISRPVLMDLNYQFSGLIAGEVYPLTLTHLYLDRPLLLYGRCRKDTEQTVVRIVGDSIDSKRDMIFDLDWDEATQGDSFIQTQWVWHRIYYLIGEHIRTDDPNVMTEIRALADEYGLPVPYGGDIALP